MKAKFFLLMGGLALAIAAPALATPVTFNTNTSQLCVGASGCGVQTQTFNNIVTVTYTPVAASVNSPSNTNFGSLQISCVGGGTACGSQSLAGLNLFIVITETAPGGGSGNIPAGVITGTVSGTASNAVVTWANPSQTIIVAGGSSITYSISNLNLGLVPPSTSGGITTIQAQITDTPTGGVPEPTSMILFGSGFLAVGLVARARRKRS